MDLDVADIAELFSVAENEVYRWIKRKEIPITCVQGEYRFNRSDLIEWAIARKIKFSPKIFQEPQLPDLKPVRPASLPSLTTALEKGGIF
ncbi:MAG: helix-turn-helix domain-containing protein [bacterium]|nr:helix-turn-helix domain-containing protein [bacterium]